MKRFQRPSARARARSSTRIAGYGTPGPTSSSRAASASASTGSTCSRMKERTRSRSASTSGEGAKSMHRRLTGGSAGGSDLGRGRPHRRRPVERAMLGERAGERRTVRMATIRRVTETDLAELAPLVRAYCDFYGVAPSEEDLLALSRALIADPEHEGV